MATTPTRLPLLGLTPLPLHSPCRPGLPDLTVSEQGWSPLWSPEENPLQNAVKEQPAFLNASRDRPHQLTVSRGQIPTRYCPANLLSAVLALWGQAPGG